ncbi:MAG TPA: tetratricopeptide repeat protein [Myxococcales bacterium]|jgi:tetratricopeptide (TPR) repeat protein|nr:tetratricopeptide repeat protein [Myxococcales bacterium]
MSTSPDQLEQRAERAVRRGELLVALELFDAALAQRPEDERVRLRMESVRALLQPSELVHRRRTEPEETAPGAEPLSDAEEGELHASSGRFAEATEAYQRALSRNPENGLIRERLEELEQLAPPGSRAVDDGLAGAPRLEAVARADVAGSSRAARAADSAFRPLETRPGSSPPLQSVQPGGRPPAAPARPAAQKPPAPPRTGGQKAPAPAAPLPRDTVDMLNALLTRIRGGKRSKRADA